MVGGKVSIVLLAVGGLLAATPPAPATPSTGAQTSSRVGPVHGITAEGDQTRPDRDLSTLPPREVWHRATAASGSRKNVDLAPAASLPGGRSLMQRAPSLHPCGFDDTLLCGAVTVPLDRFGGGGGTIDVRYVVAPHTGPAATPKGAVFATSGGPGNSITGSNGEMYPFRDFVLPQLTPTYDLVFVDQRGVGRSGALYCPALQHHGYTYEHAAACARKYGAERNMYSTAAVADDLDDIRAQLGFEQIIGMGGSYAGTDMTTYAVRHPDHTARVVIASPAPPFAKPHQFDDLTPKALPGYVERACDRSVNCHAAFPNPRPLVAWLVQRLREHPLTGFGFDNEGDRHRVRVTESTLAWNIMLDGDFPFPYAQLPAAAAALRAGDSTPLLRLAATHLIQVDRDEGPSRDYSQAANLFRACVDDDNAWDESAPPSERRSQYADALAAEPERFGLFSKQAWAKPLPQGYFPSPCIASSWVHRAPFSRHAPEDGVPTLILTGDMDNGLATAISRQVTGVLTDSTLVEVEQAGHNPWFWTECARRMVRSFIRTGARDDLCAGAPFVKRWEPGAFARRLDDIPAARPRAGDESTLADRRLATATTWTLLDSIHQLVRSETAHSRGLRGGRTSAVFSPGPPTPDEYRLVAARFTQTVAVTGKGYWDFDNGVGGDFSVRAPGVTNATLHVRGHWYLENPGPTLVRGTIDGRHIDVQLPSS